MTKKLSNELDVLLGLSMIKKAVVHDPIENAGEPVGICDCCGKLGNLDVGLVSIFGQFEFWCEDCRNAIEPKEDRE